MKREPPIKNRFKPGQSGNPSSRAKLSDEVKRIRALSQEQIEEVGDLILTGNAEALENMRTDPSAPALKVALASVVIEIIKRGDMSSLNSLLDRLVGKIPNRLESDLEFKLAIVQRIEQASHADVLGRLPEAIKALQSGGDDESL